MAGNFSVMAVVAAMKAGVFEPPAFAPFVRSRD
jgi:hypothetical protein